MAEDDVFNRKVNEVDKSGATRFGDSWKICLDALHRSTGGVGIERGAMEQILKTPDPAQLLERAGREQLLTEADGGNKESEYNYSKIREAEREQHRKLKGRA